MLSRVRIADGSPRAGVAKLADASDLGSDGKPWGFKSSHPHHVQPIEVVFFLLFVDEEKILNGNS